MTTEEPYSLGSLIAEKAGVTSDIIDQMVKNGWVPVTESRLPYDVDVDLSRFAQGTGLTVVDSPVFSANGTEHFAAAYKCRVEIRNVTDDPKNLFVNTDLLYPLIIDGIKRIKLTHLFQVVIYRHDLYGYLPPHASVMIRGARVFPVGYV